MARITDTANLQKRGTVWWLRKTVAGELHWLSLETGDAAEARRRRDRYLADLASGRWGQSRTRTINDLADMFTRDHMPTLKPSSRQR